MPDVPPVFLAGIEAHLQTLNLPEQQRLEVLADIEEKLAAASPGTTLARDTLRLDFARRLLKFHLRVNDLFGARLFRDATWPMLLDLFATAQEGRKSSVTKLAQGLGISPTTGLRQVERMEEEGLITRRDDPHDARRTIIEPTAKAMQGVARVLDSMRSEL